MSLYNEFVQDHYRHPRNLGRLEGATSSVRVFRGDAMLEFHVRVAGDSVEAATFRAIGCAGTVAAGSAMTEWLIGRRVVEAQGVTAQTVLDVLGGLPEERLYCADFAAEGIRGVMGG
ncbi:MAG: iron-sulfur cluster assembly scaffold protein [Chloroflexota bacterium]|nr:iron-sulfur cluster assembly scaffold protein [Chloroflexota bacterium]